MNNAMLVAECMDGAAYGVNIPCNNTLTLVMLTPTTADPTPFLRDFPSFLLLFLCGSGQICCYREAGARSPNELVGEP